MAVISKKRSGVAAAAAVPATQPPEDKKDTTKKQTESKAKQPAKAKKGGVQKKKFRKSSKMKGTGLLFIKHLPNGFNEDQMREFFKQFGEIVRVCIARSKTTTRCKGYGYVHFRYYEVAEIAASAVDNYMMFGRVLKAVALPKNVTRVPRNFGRAYNSKGEQTAAYRKWLGRTIKSSNKYLGPKSLLERVSKRVKRLERAEQELREAGIELPETKNCLEKLQAKTKDLEEQVQEKLAKKAASTKPVKMDVDQKVAKEKGEPDDDGDVEEDQETAFSALQPSDWKEVEPTATETPDTAANKAQAVKKAQETKKEFAVKKSKTEKPVATSNKENKQATPAKKQPKKAKLPLSKKKQSEETVVPSPKAKGKVTAKNAKPAKMGRKVK